MKAIRSVVAVSVISSMALGASIYYLAGQDWPGAQSKNGSIRLPNGERIKPVGRVHIPLRGDMPLSMASSADGSQCFVVTGGYHDHGVAVLNLSDETTDSFVGTTKCTGGITQLPDGTMYVASGDLGVRRIVPSSSKDTFFSTGFKLPNHAWIQGLAALPDGSILATDINNDQLLCYRPKESEPIWTLATGHKPNRIAIDLTTRRIAITNWGGSSVDLVDFSGKLIKRLGVGIQPSDLVFKKDGTLFVSNAGSNTVSVVQADAVISTFFTSLTAKDLIGSTPSGLALSPDEKHLYVANSGSNNVAQIDVSDPVHPGVEGFIPTGWYPTTVFAPKGGKTLLIGTAKGLATKGNFPGARVEQTVTDDLRNHYDYLPNTLQGDVMVLDVPNKKELSEYTATCRANAQREMSAKLLADEKALVPTLQRIKHVIYVIRENRSFDQVLGDLPGTNAEPRLCMYGENITPNGHKIAREFKTFDNLYCDGEVSQDGHQWCCSSYCTDFTEKIWPTGYADRGTPDEDESVASSPAGYLWDNCRTHGLTYRSYGEFASFKANKNTAPKYEGVSGLEGHACEKWSLSDARDKDKVDVFTDEMKSAEKTGQWWNFMVMSLGEDHTAGRSPGDFTPFSKVASNDLGLGKLVEAVSHSKFWADTAIFVIEDDAQDGPDHVDGHRTVGYVISPYIKRGGVDHHLYSTASMIRTMELMLGLPPMSQHDRHATSMVASFSRIPNTSPFTHEDVRIDLSKRNPKQGALALESSKLDFSAYDRADPQLLNRILWADAKPGVRYPVISHLSR